MNKNSLSPGNFRLKIKSLKCYWVAILIAAIWLSIILYYTRGGLLVGGDTPGYYNAVVAFSTGIPDAITYGIGLLLACRNIYVGFYVGTFIGICLNLFALTYFLNTLFKEWRGKIVPLAVANILYVFNMFSIYNTFKSVIALSDIATSGLLLFLALAVKLYRYMNKSGRFTKLDCVLMGIGIAVSSMVPPNSFRIIVVEGAIVVGLLFLAMIKQGAVKTSNIKIVIRNFILTLPIIALVAIAGMMYWEWNFFSSFTSNVGTSLQAAQSLGLSSFYAPYANLINSFRVLGVWAFQTGYCPYHNLFYSNAVVTIASFIWPIIALGVSLLLVKSSYRLKILLLVALSLVIISWDTANNPPVGAINLFAVSHVPYLSSFFQTFYLSGTLLPIIYIALSAFVVVRLMELLRGSKRVFHFRYKKFVMIIPLLLIVLLLVPDVPFFTGDALGQYFNSNVKGIWVPNDYLEVKDILSSSMQSGNTVLLWPSTTIYVQTSWGYEGGSSFYNNFFAPLTVFTPISFGVYSFANPSIAAEYSTLTSVPITAGNSTDITSFIDFANLSVFGASYTYLDSTVKLSLASINNSDHVDVAIPFHDTVDLSSYAYVTLQFSAEPESIFSNILGNESMWVGIGDPHNIGWYILGSSSSSSYSVTNNAVTISMLVGFPDSPWPTSVYNSSSVTGFVIHILGQGLSNTPNAELSLSNITVNVSSAAVDQSVLNLWRQHKVEYVMFDNSIVSGGTFPSGEYSSSINTLVNKEVLIPVFAGKYLQLYKVNYGVSS